MAIYDIEYFYDVAVTSDKRKRLSGVEDLVKLDDSELVKGAKEIDMISDIGYRHLDYIKYMRIRIPIHPAFLENNDENLAENSYEKATNKLSKKKNSIIKF